MQINQTVVNWQPIETAPKDGTPVLLACPNKYGFYVDVGQNFYDNEYKEEDDVWRPRESTNNDVIGEPSHWAPLPLPPEIENLEES